MSSDESAQIGMRDALRLREPIASSLALVASIKGSKVQWWGAFFAALASMCFRDLGQEAHDIILAVTTEALKRHASRNTTGRPTQ